MVLDPVFLGILRYSIASPLRIQYSIFRPVTILFFESWCSVVTHHFLKRPADFACAAFLFFNASFFQIPGRSDEWWPAWTTRQRLWNVFSCACMALDTNVSQHLNMILVFWNNAAGLSLGPRFRSIICLDVIGWPNAVLLHRLWPSRPGTVESRHWVWNPKLGIDKVEYWAWPLPVGFVDNNGKAIFVPEAAFQDGTPHPVPNAERTNWEDCGWNTSERDWLNITWFDRRLTGERCCSSMSMHFSQFLSQLM